MKNLLYLLLTTKLICCISNMQPNYKITGWSEANELRLKAGSELIMIVEYNKAKIYHLADSTYVIMPISPFAKCLITKSRDLLDKWISDSHFPTNEDINSFYFKNKEKISNLNRIKETLINELATVIGIDLKHLQDSSKIDNVYEILKKRRLFDKYKLNFIVLVGDYILNKYPMDNLHLSKLKHKQFLNPVIEIALSRFINGEERYFNLQELIIGKWGYRGIKDIEKSYDRKWFRPNEFVIIEN